MVLFMILLIILGMLFIGLCLGATLLLEPLICIGLIYLVYKIVRKCIIKV